METWNLDELYSEVWEQPLVKVAPKYWIIGSQQWFLERSATNFRFLCRVADIG